MDIQIRDQLMEHWEKYFPKTELPLAFFYTNTPEVPPEMTPSGHRCIFADINKVRKGKSMVFNKENIGCPGGQKYAGYRHEISSAFPYFLSCGIEGELEGERYKKSPELVKLMMEELPEINADDKSLVFKRWDKLSENDQPQVVICFAGSDAISGLFMLANYDRAGNNNVISTMGSGCSQTILYPYLEHGKIGPKAFLGMFDPSARPFINENLLSFATTYDRFVQLIGNMEESFLITKTWASLSNRMRQG